MNHPSKDNIWMAILVPITMSERERESEWVRGIPSPHRKKT